MAQAISKAFLNWTFGKAWIVARNLAISLNLVVYLHKYTTEQTHSGVCSQITLWESFHGDGGATVNGTGLLFCGRRA
jgi:hypothetical protein